MRLTNIDALRGVASLSVVLYHGIGSFEGFLNNPNILTVVPAFGFSGVYLFFVISGFCIHLRWVKGQHVDFIPFWKRRIKRLYPAYLASLALFLWWNGFTSVHDVVLHLVMLHNWTPESVYSINGVLWTLAIEEQLYLLYFVLLKMRARWGWPTTLAILFLTRFAFLAVSYKTGIPFAESALSNWFIWALGAVAVEQYCGKTRVPKISGLPILFTAAVLHYIGTQDAFWSKIALAIEQYIWGIGFFFLLVSVMRYEGKKNIVIAVFSAIGLFSYSLYLMHPIVPVWAALPIAYIFFLLFERPFISKSRMSSIAVAG